MNMLKVTESPSLSRTTMSRYAKEGAGSGALSCLVLARTRPLEVNAQPSHRIGRGSAAPFCRQPLGHIVGVYYCKRLASHLGACVDHDCTM